MKRHRNRCAGACCAAFVLPSFPSLDHVAGVFEMAHHRIAKGKRDRVDSDNIMIEDMLLVLPHPGAWEPWRRDLAHPATQVEARQTGCAFTCRHFNHETLSCGIYAKRPAMCRDFPGDRACNICGFKQRPSKGVRLRREAAKLAMRKRNKNSKRINARHFTKTVEWRIPDTDPEPTEGP